MKKTIRLVSYNKLIRIFVKPTKQVFLLSVFCMVMFGQTPCAVAVLPVTGVEVPELATIDNLMQSYMQSNGLWGGVLAISKDGRVVYQRGFGYAYYNSPSDPPDDPLPENTPMRLASVEKPHTAAVIRHLVSYGLFSLDDYVFDVGQRLEVGRRALLDASTPSSTYYPYNGVYGDGRFGSITVDHLLNHQGGWDRTIAYCPFGNGKLYEIGNVTGTYPSLPPTREDIVRYMMSQPLQFDPGNRPIRCDFNDIDGDGDKECTETPMPCYCDSYSNFGYMLLSLIIEQETGQQQHTEMIRQLVMTPDIWVPSTEIILGTDLRDDQNPREPRYMESSNACRNLNDPYDIYPPSSDLFVPCPYGGLLMEVKTGEGNLVGSAAPLMMFMNHYNSASGAPISGPTNAAKNGGLDGTSTRIEQRSNGFNVVILFNQGGGHADVLMPQVYTYLGLLVGVDWASLSEIDGFWVDFGESSSGFGGHNDPFHTMNDALTATTDGTKLRFKTGTSNWTGTISKKMLLNSPFGTAIIGQ